MCVQRTSSPEAALILKHLERNTIDYKQAAVLTNLHPTSARRHLKALHNAGLIHVSRWFRDRVKRGPFWPVYSLGGGLDEPYPSDRGKEGLAIRRRLKECPHVVDPILSALLGAKR